MKQRDNYMLCCDCGYAVKAKNMFNKVYKNTAICLCRKCAVKLCAELADYGIANVIEKSKGEQTKNSEN